MELTSARVPATRLPMRQLGVLALIAILLAAALAVYVGSRQQKLPAPFGPAANGLIPYESGGDISRPPVTAAALAGLLALVDKGAISGAMAKDVFAKMAASGAPADEIVRREGLAQIDDEAQIRGLIAAVVRANEDAVAQYRAGKAATFGFLVGQVMKTAGGKANPRRVNELLKRELDAPAEQG